MNEQPNIDWCKVLYNGKGYGVAFTKEELEALRQIDRETNDRIE